MFGMSSKKASDVNRDLGFGAVVASSSAERLQAVAAFRIRRADGSPANT